MLTQARLKELLHYSRKTGVFSWRVSLGSRIRGSEVTSTSSNGYVRVRVDRKLYYGHRLAWLYVKGDWPSAFLDHRNRCRADNRWENLRVATKIQNNRNSGKRKSNKSGYKGVCYHPATGKWRAYCGVAGNKSKHLGLFATPEEASAAYQSFAKQHHKEFFYEI